MLALARATMAMGAFVVLGALWCLFFVPRDSGAFVIAVTTLIIGGAVVAVTAALARRELRRGSRPVSLSAQMRSTPTQEDQ